MSREDGGTGRDTKEERTGGRGWKGREREAEGRGSEKERRPARTILINPVPGSRSRSNRVHDLQGIYIRSSTRGYNSIPSFYSALSAGLKQPARHGLSLSFFLYPRARPRIRLCVRTRAVDTKRRRAQSLRSRRGFPSYPYLGEHRR